MEKRKYNLNDIVQLRKMHPCGSDQWKILRLGSDFRIQCLKCGRLVMLPRVKFEKMVKKIIANGEQVEED